MKKKSKKGAISPAFFHFIGIGGISMSGLAKFLHTNGYRVKGSEIKESETTKELRSLGIEVKIGHSRANIQDANIVVVTNAIDENNAELLYAKKKKRKIYTRGELLGFISSLFKKTIAVAGSHGKTTTTSMIGKILIDAKKNPTVHIGGISKDYSTNFICGNKKLLVTEACEFRNSFLSLSPSVGVILNIEADHLDFFKNLDNLKKSFDKFNSNSKFTIDEDYVSSHASIEHLKKDELGRHSFEAYWDNKRIGKISLKLPQLHNVKNALFALSVAKFMRVPNRTIVASLNSFSGVKRRFEHVGDFNGAKVITDYAHHPTEIKKSIESAHETTTGKLHVVFQPHTYTRTKALFNEFVKAFEKEKNLYIYKTYPAREKFDKSGSSRQLAAALPFSKHFSSYQSLKTDLQSKINFSDTILILGAGDIDEFCQHLMQEDKKN